jgi:hypothetical protein
MTSITTKTTKFKRSSFSAFGFLLSSWMPRKRPMTATPTPARK